MDRIPNTPGIYVIRNLINGNIYVGSAVNLRKRCREHFAELESQKHYNEYLQRAFNKYGKDAFVFEVVEFVEVKENLIAREQFHIDLLAPEYNISPTAGSPLGVKHTDEMRAKVRAARAKQVFTAESKARMSAAKKGKKKSEETKVKMRESWKLRDRAAIAAKVSAGQKGKTISPELRKRLSELNKGKPGRPLSPEAAEKLRIANTGKRHSEETKAKISAAGKGRTPPNKGKPSPSKGIPRSEEDKKKMSEAAQKNMENPEYRAMVVERNRQSAEKRRASGKYMGRKHSEETKAKMRKSWEKRRAAKQALEAAQQTQPPTQNLSPIAPFDTSEYTQLSLWEEDVS